MTTVEKAYVGLGNFPLVHVVKAAVRRMTTSRTGDTKYEHFATLYNSDGKTLDFTMRHDPAEALFSAMKFAKFLGVPCDPLVIDGKTIELDRVLKSMLEDDCTCTGPVHRRGCPDFVMTL